MISRILQLILLIQPFYSENGKDENNVLLFNIMNPIYPITVEVIHRICTPFGKVARIVILRKNGIQAMVEFDDVKSAIEAKEELQGADIYTDCCTIHVDFSKVSFRFTQNEFFD
jgi:hypothetical protein